MRESQGETPAGPSLQHPPNNVQFSLMALKRTTTRCSSAVLVSVTRSSAWHDLILFIRSSFSTDA